MIKCRTFQRLTIFLLFEEFARFFSFWFTFSCVCWLFGCWWWCSIFCYDAPDLISSAWLNGLAGLLFATHSYHLDMLRIDSKETKLYCLILNSIIKTTNSNAMNEREKSMDLNVRKKNIFFKQWYIKCMLQIVDPQSEMWMLLLWILNDSSQIPIYNDTTT